MSIRSVLGSRASIGGPLGSGRGGAAAAWYLAGGVSAANCIAAYTPKGAASLAASYDNNAAPGNGLADGTYDAAPGVAPTFDTATGWTFNGSTQYLTTGITPASGWSMIVRFSDSSQFTSRYIIGQHTTNASFRIGWQSSSLIDYWNGGVLTISGTITEGILAIAGQTAYRNGSAETGSIPAWSASASNRIFLGARNFGGAGGYFAGKMQAAAIYNVTLSAATVAAIFSAMSAL